MRRLVSSACAFAMLAALASPAAAQPAAPPCTTPIKSLGPGSESGPAHFRQVNVDYRVVYDGVELAMGGRAQRFVLVSAEAAVLRSDAHIYIRGQVLVDEQGQAQPGLTVLDVEIKGAPQAFLECVQDGIDLTTGYELTTADGGRVTVPISSVPMVLHPGFNPTQTGHTTAPPLIANALFGGGTVNGQAFVSLSSNRPTIGGCAAAPIPGHFMRATVARADLPPIRFQPIDVIKPDEVWAASSGLFAARAAGRCRFMPMVLNPIGSVGPALDNDMPGVVGPFARRRPG